jgi:mRNA interferase MazF
MKNFDDWHKIKKSIDNNSRPPFFNEREVWWLSIGVNVGYEIFGKGETFTRPVVIVKKMGRYTFLGVPLTSKRRDLPFCVPIDFDGKNGSALITQLRTLDSRRLVERIGTLGSKQVSLIRDAIKNML